MEKALSLGLEKRLGFANRLLKGIGNEERRKIGTALTMHGACSSFSGNSGSASIILTGGKGRGID